MENNTYKIKVIEGWVNQYGDDLFAWAMHKTRSKELAEDLVQETYIACFKSFESFQSKSHPKTWLIAILNNKIMDNYRKKNRLSLISYENNSMLVADNFFDKNNNWYDEASIDFWETKENLGYDEQYKALLKTCLDNLPKKWNLALTYKYLTNKKTEEICQELEISISNYWQIVHRAKLQLKKGMKTSWCG